MNNILLIFLITSICVLLYLELISYIENIKLKGKNAQLQASLELIIIRWMNERISNSPEEDKNRLSKIKKLKSRIVLQELCSPGSIDPDNIKDGSQH